MEAVRVLAHEIGPRPPCSAGERRAAGWCAARLDEEGHEAVVEEFPSRTSNAGLLAAYFGAAIVGALLIVPFPLGAAVIGLAAAVLYAREVDGRPLIRLFRGTSRNVVARPRASSGPPDMIVTAQLDGRAHAALASIWGGALVRPFGHAVHAALFAVPLVAAGAWVTEAGHDLPARLWVVAGCIVVILLGAIAATVVGGPGDANNDASGVEVVMRLAATGPRPGVWFLLTGSGSSGGIGVQAFVERHASEIGHPRFLAVGPVGRGTLSVTTEEGVVRERRADRHLWSAAEEAGAQTRAYRGFPTSVSTLLARRFRATELVGLGPRDLVPHPGAPPGDVAEDPFSPSGESLHQATEVAAALVTVALRAGS